MTIAGNGSARPLELQLARVKIQQTHGPVRLLLTGGALLKWVWWHVKSYLSIVGLLLLALGSLVVLQGHWLSRRIVHIPLRQKEVLKNVG